MHQARRTPARPIAAWLAGPLIALALPVLAARGPDVPDYPADEVAPGLYVIHGPVGYPSPENQGFMNNPAFLVTETGVIVVDPGSSVQTGEMVLRQIRMRMDDGSFRGSVEALDAVQGVVEARVLVPGHGLTGGWDIVDDYRAYLNGVYTGVAELYEQGVSDFDMKPKLAERLARFKDWPGFSEELGKHISLAYLEVEAGAF